MSRNGGGIVTPTLTLDFDSECFLIVPIGESGSKTRKRSDEVREWIVKPAAQAAGNLRTLRADDVGEPGQITAQAVQHCLRAKAAVADLTGGNPNVYYELSVRHGAQLPVVLIAEDGTDLPFDISQSRVIFFDHTNLGSSNKAKDELQAQIEASLTGAPDNPISDGMRLAKLQAGSVEEQTLAAVLDRLQRLASTTEQIDQRLGRAERARSYGGWAGTDYPLRGTIQPRGTVPQGGAITPGEVIRTMDGRTFRVEGSDSPYEVMEVFGAEAFDSDTAGLSPEEKAEMEAENRLRKEQEGTRPSSNDEPEVGG